MREREREREREQYRHVLRYIFLISEHFQIVRQNKFFFEFDVVALVHYFLYLSCYSFSLYLFLSGANGKTLPKGCLCISNKECIRSKKFYYFSLHDI